MADEHNIDLGLLRDLLWPTEQREVAHRPEDRVVAIICVSYVEKYLGRLIQAKLPGLNKKLREKILDPDGWLGTLAAKIDVAQALNLIDHGLAHDLKKMASIRNGFAHNLDITTFDHPEIATRFDAMKLTEQIGGILPEGAGIWRDVFRATSSRAEKFRQVGWYVCTRLNSTVDEVGAADSHGPIDE